MWEKICSGFEFALRLGSGFRVAQCGEGDHDFFATTAISVESEEKALPATSAYSSFILKPFSSNSFFSESTL
jgi:hypothetical protein